MNIAAHAQNLYGQARSLKSPRDLEYEVFARVTGRLQAARSASGSRATPTLIAALHENRQLWTLLAFDLAHPDNAFPADLRARLFYLAEFTLKTSDQLVAGTGEVDVLIDINTSVMRGLRGEVAQ